MDPCEKSTVDTLTAIGEQEREDITLSAQVQALNYSSVYFWTLQNGTCVKRFKLGRSDESTSTQLDF